MSHFDYAIPTILQHEGGFVDDPHDCGGATNYGISLRWLQRCQELLIRGENQTTEVTVDTIRELTRDEAIDLYRRYFWQPHRYERIHDQRIATKVFDLNVNAGSHVAHTCLQWAIRAVSGAVLVIDGSLGEKTLAATNACEAALLVIALRCEASAYYRSLKQPHFEAGWLARAYV